MNLVALVESPDHVCCRYRVRAFADGLRAAGHSLDVHSLPVGLWERFRLGRDLGAFDAVILQRRLLPVWQLHALRRRVRRLVFDFDDAVFLRDSFSPKTSISARRWNRFSATIRAADAVVAGNAWLAAKAGPNAVVVPTCVDPSAYPLARHETNGSGVRLVWVGSSSTLQGLESQRPLLESLGHALPGLRLKLICDRFLKLRRVAVERCDWSESTEAAEIADADIGIAWIPDDDWSRGKCGLKVLQYMAAGLPVIANPVGVHASMVRHGETGYLAETPREWADAVAKLAHDPAKRRRMGLVGRRSVEENCSVAAGVERWRALLADLLRRERAAG